MRAPARVRNLALTSPLPVRWGRACNPVAHRAWATGLNGVNGHDVTARPYVDAMDLLFRYIVIFIMFHIISIQRLTKEGYPSRARLAVNLLRAAALHRVPVMNLCGNCAAEAAPKVWEKHLEHIEEHLVKLPSVTQQAMAAAFIKGVAMRIAEAHGTVDNSNVNPFIGLFPRSPAQRTEVKETKMSCGFIAMTVTPRNLLGSVVRIMCCHSGEQLDPPPT